VPTAPVHVMTKLRVGMTLPSRGVKEERPSMNRTILLESESSIFPAFNSPRGREISEEKWTVPLPAVLIAEFSLFRPCGGHPEVK
jgi:hypothetical protein